jgi:hypothetical protein
MSHSDPPRHFMPPGLRPACGISESLPTRAIDRNQVTCPECRAYLIASGSDPLRVERSLAGLDSWME